VAIILRCDILRLKTDKIEGFLYNLVFILTFLGVFFVIHDSSFPMYSQTKILNYILISSLIIITIILLFIEKLKFKLINSMIIVLLIISTIFSIYKGNFNYYYIYIPIFIYIGKKKNLILKKEIKYFVLISTFFSILIQLYNFRFRNITPVLSWRGPNYSGYFIFIFFLFCMTEKSKLIKTIGYISLFLGFLTLSRTYLVVTILYFLFKMNLFKKTFLFLKLYNFYTLLIVSLILVFFIGNLFLLLVNNPANIEYDASRLLNMNLADGSNYVRFLANNELIKNLFSNYSIFFQGIDVSVYKELYGLNIPHNILLKMITIFGGFFTFIYIYIIGYYYNRFRSKGNIPIFVTLFFYFSFLGPPVWGFPLLLTIFLLKENQKYYMKWSVKNIE